MVRNEQDPYYVSCSSCGCTYFLCNWMWQLRCCNLANQLNILEG